MLFLSDRTYGALGQHMQPGIFTRPAPFRLARNCTVNIGVTQSAKFSFLGWCKTKMSSRQQLQNDEPRM
jgi:hypothetical protein